MKKNLFDTFSLQILNATFYCNFQTMSQTWWHYLQKNLCLFSKSVGTDICREDFKLEGRHSFRSSIVNQTLFNLSKTCRHYRHIGIKTIRLTDIQLLNQLTTSSHLNIKILHLVRDPRGIMNSRFAETEKNVEFLRKKGKTGDETSDLCRSVYRNLNYINSGKENLSWLNDGYKLIRYEDTAMNPTKSAQEIYEFLGIPFPEPLYDWIEANTKFNKGGQRSHTRNSKSIAHAWRQHLNLSDVLHVQDKCRKVMTLLGYNIVNSTQQLLDTSYSVMGSLPTTTVTLL